jgi:formiminotetrahydrofolate cyclodeaminase
VSEPSFADMTLHQLLVAFSDANPVPGGGGAAVVAVALAASLCAMSARLSDRHSEHAPDIAAEALAIRAEMAPLCDEDARSYLAVVAASRAPEEPDPDDHRRRLADALSSASDVPMATVRAGARLARLAALLAQEGNPSLRGDAVVAALLAGAGAQGAGTLVRINLAGVPADERHDEVRALLDDTAEWVELARRSAAAPS